MTLDRGKLAVWVLVLTALAGGIVLRYEHKPHHVPVPAPVAVQEPAPVPPVVVPTPLPPEPAPVVQQAPLPDPVPKTHPTPVAAPRTPVVQHRKPATPPKTLKTPKKAVSKCAKVPAAAYTHDKDTVISFAKARGVSDVDMAILKACIGA